MSDEGFSRALAAWIVLICLAILGMHLLPVQPGKVVHQKILKGGPSCGREFGSGPDGCEVHLITPQKVVATPARSTETPRADRDVRPVDPELAWASSPAALAVRQCESSGRYSVVSHHAGVTYYGAWQFDLRTWRSVGGLGLPSRQPKEVQDHFAYQLFLQRGWQPWQCAANAGLL